MSRARYILESQMPLKTAVSVEYLGSVSEMNTGTFNKIEAASGYTQVALHPELNLL
jgi:hypothetical protein